MPFDPATHHRRSIRRPGSDYSAVGAYFVTICAQNRSCLFGDVLDGQMVPNDAGRMILAEWQTLADPQDGRVLDEFVLMPNHFHGVIALRSILRPLTLVGPLDDPRPHGTLPGTIGRAIQGFKSVTTHHYAQGVHQHGWRRFSGHLWQRDYFDHVIRDDWSLDRIREYVRTNPERWGRDVENPAGTGGDDVRQWVERLTARQPDGALTGAGGRDGPRRGQTEGEHKVRPYGAEGPPGGHEVRTRGQGRTQGSPLRASRASPLPRIGHGYDLHRLQPGGVLVLGGVEVSRDVSPIAHSDGDVVLHATVDALLGAMGWGDIGELFPNTDDRWRGAPSRVFVDEVFARVTAAGYVVGNIDVTILAERPKLKAFKPAIARAVAELLRVDVSQVNVKAGTNEGCDAIGRGEAIAAHAVVLLAAGEPGA